MAFVHKSRPLRRYEKRIQKLYYDNTQTPIYPATPTPIFTIHSFLLSLHCIYSLRFVSRIEFIWQTLLAFRTTNDLFASGDG